MSSKEDGGGGGAPSKPNLECCICGDYGLSYELFRCSVCLLRSQHRYCSNLYPKEESYRVCNWCLYKEGGKIQETHTYKNNNNKDEEDKNKKRKKKKIQRSTTSQTDIISKPIKKQRSLDRSSTRKRRIINLGGGGGHIEESLRRTKSEPIVNIETTKRVFKGKIRRYKLLEEVST